METCRQATTSMFCIITVLTTSLMITKSNEFQRKRLIASCRESTSPLLSEHNQLSASAATLLGGFTHCTSPPASCSQLVAPTTGTIATQTLASALSIGYASAGPASTGTIVALVQLIPGEKASEVCRSNSHGEALLIQTCSASDPRIALNAVGADSSDCSMAADTDSNSDGQQLASGPLASGYNV